MVERFQVAALAFALGLAPRSTPALLLSAKMCCWLCELHAAQPSQATPFAADTLQAHLQARRPRSSCDAGGAASGGCSRHWCLLQATRGGGLPLRRPGQLLRLAQRLRGTGSKVLQQGGVSGPRRGGTSAQ